jgi:rhodanese-related sulfurtransferase
MSKEVVILDVRELDEYDIEHVPGSVLVPYSRFGSLAPGVLLQLRGKQIQLLCRSGNRARLALQEITELGYGSDFPDATVLEGGITAWLASGKPIEGTPSRRLPIMRQVQLVTGLGVVGFSLAAHFVHPAWMYGAIFFGSGLVLAGGTGWCGLALLLAQMPWNRSDSKRHS